jgi:glycosyltransferase involved in cell wall biosynthesis
MPTKNRRRLLDRAISSVLKQEDVEVIVIVVDDGSDDDTAQFVAGHSDRRIQLVRHENSRGVSAARNAGLERVTTPWVSFLDDDDVWSPHKLRNQLAALQASADNRRWAVSAAAFIDANGHVLGIQYPKTVPMIPALLRINVVPGGGSGVLAATDLVREVGGFDDRLSNLADWDMWIRLSRYGEPVAVRRADVGYYLHRGSMSLDIERSRTERGRILEKYADLLAQHDGPNDYVEWHRYLGDMCMRGGHRREALLEYRLAGHRGPSKAIVLAKMSLTAVAPSVYDLARRTVRLRKGVPDVAVVHEWLQQLPAAPSTHTE